MAKLDYRAVGYANPPKRTRFRKGRSGNPSGRPKGARSFKSVFEKELAQTVRVTENGASLEITKMELAIKALLAKAAKGDVRALGLLVGVVRAYGIGAEEEMQEVDLPAEHMAVLARFIARQKPAPAKGGRKPNG